MKNSPQTQLYVGFKKWVRVIKEKDGNIRGKSQKQDTVSVMYPYRLISCVVYTVTYGDGHLDLKPRQDQLNIYNAKYREDEIRVGKEEKK